MTSQYTEVPTREAFEQQQQAVGVIASHTGQLVDHELRLQAQQQRGDSLENRIAVLEADASDPTPAPLPEEPPDPGPEPDEPPEEPAPPPADGRTWRTIRAVDFDESMNALWSHFSPTGTGGSVLLKGPGVVGSCYLQITRPHQARVVGDVLMLEQLPSDPQWKGSVGYRVELHPQDGAPSNGTVRRYRAHRRYPLDWNPGVQPDSNQTYSVGPQWHGGGGMPKGSSPLWAGKTIKGAAKPRLLIDRKLLDSRWEHIASPVLEYDPGRWYAEEWEIKWSTGTDGYVIFKRDGQRLYEFRGRTMYASTTASLKWGIYGQPLRVHYREVIIEELLA